MHIVFELTKDSDRTDAAFRYLRVSLFKLHFERWAQKYRIRDFQFSSHEGNVRIQFRHRSDWSVFGLAWDDYNGYSYSIVGNEKNPVRP